MKIKIDFISNSSSTSFVYISDKDLNREDFFDAAGVSPDSPVADLFTGMYYELSDNISRGQKLNSIQSLEELSDRHEFTDKTIAEMKAAILAGKNVVVSALSSDGPFAESILCTEIFEIKSDKFHINAYSNYW
jgi:hypothetical protein